MNDIQSHVSFLPRLEGLPRAPVRPADKDVAKDVAAPPGDESALLPLLLPESELEGVFDDPSLEGECSAELGTRVMNLEAVAESPIEEDEPLRLRPREGRMLS